MYKNIFGFVNFFSNIGRADELGSGVRNLYKYTKIYAGGEPILFEDDVFRIEVPIYEKPIKAGKKPIKADKFGLTDNEKKVLEYLKEHDSISNSEARDILNLAESTTKRILADMVNKHLLTAVGERKARKYIIK